MNFASQGISARYCSGVHAQPLVPRNLKPGALPGGNGSGNGPHLGWQFHPEILVEIGTENVLGGRDGARGHLEPRRHASLASFSRHAMARVFSPSFSTPSGMANLRVVKLRCANSFGALEQGPAIQHQGDLALTAARRRHGP